MKILTVMMQYDYGVKERGVSFEYNNIFLPLRNIVKDENLRLFDFMETFKKLGKERMNQELLETFNTFEPDLVIFFPFEDEIEEETVKKISEQTTTASYFFDDPWRQQYVRKWIRLVDYFTTPDYYMYQQYLHEGLDKAIFVPFGFNEEVFQKRDLPFKYDVSFVGGYNPLREWIVTYLKKHGISVAVFGRGWGKDVPWVSFDEMGDVFNQSRINLNLSNGISYDISYIFSSMKSLRGLKGLLLNKKTREQVKGRHYEINGCGGFQLSYYVPGLNIAYEIDKEIAVFDTIRNLPDQIKFYLEHESLRKSISERGYERSLREHSSKQYLQNMLECITDKNQEST